MNIIKKLLLSLMILAIPSQSFAIVPIDRKAVTNDYPFYELNDICEAGGSADSSNLTGGTNAEKAYNYFRAQGLTAAQSAGMVGNFIQESGGGTENLDPKAKNSSGYQGIAQWDKVSRWPLLEEFANKPPKRDPYDLGLQLDYAWHELTKGVRKSSLAHIKSTDTPEAAALAVNKYYEGAEGQADDKRMRYARQIFDKYKDNPVGGSSGAPPAAGGGSSGAQSIDIKDVVAKYKLQSAVILKVNGDPLAEHKSDVPPIAPASTMKLIIADTIIRSGISYREATMNAMLSVSSNEAAGELVNLMGGPSGFTDKANGYGYTKTKMTMLYSQEALDRRANKSPIGEQAKAMSHIFTETGDKYKAAQQALREGASGANNHYGVNSDANKWAGNSLVAGNVGLFKVGGQDYIIGLYFEGNFTSPESITAIKEGTADLLKLIKDGAGGSNACDSGASGDSAGIVSMAIKLSWPTERGRNPKPEYKEAMIKSNPAGYAGTGGLGDDCGVFVSTVMRESGADKKYPPSGTSIQADYVRANPDQYDIAEDVASFGELQPGDILIVNAGSGAGAAGHTFIYVGKQPNGSKTASASLNSRSANLTTDNLVGDSRGKYMRARLK